jgi:hypothetical protein
MKGGFKGYEVFTVKAPDFLIFTPPPIYFPGPAIVNPFIIYG